MKVFFALGNPGSQYNFTRHNTGFLALDFYAKCEGLEWQEKPKFHCLCAKNDNHDILLVKPQTFYNEVGQSARAIMDFYKLKAQDFLVICDDFNLDFGKLRFRERGSAGGNNGLKSCISHFNTEDFPRLRLGTANDTLRKQIGDVDFVLSHFTEKEKETLANFMNDTRKFLLQY